MENVLRKLSGALWGLPMLILIMGTGILLTLSLRFIQFRRFGASVRSAFGRDEKTSAISPFSSLCTFLSAAMGTGNIIGVAVCIKEGGIGAPVWMTIGALLTMPICFSETFLAVKNKEKGPGAAAYLKRPKVYTFLGFLSGLLGLGSVIQVSAISSGIENFSSELGKNLGNISPFVGFISAVLILIILSGGLKRVASFSEKMVPPLTVVYFVSCFLILFVFRDNIIPSVKDMLYEAFNFRSAAIGSAGGILLTISRGIAMGVFTNEAGLGTSGIAISQGVSEKPYKGGLISMFGIFVDTVLMCNLTAITFISAGGVKDSRTGWDMASEVFKKGFFFSPNLGSFILMICVCFFAFASIIGWSYYGEAFFRFTFKRLSPKIYKYLFSLAVFLGSFLSRSSLFYFSDIFNALMAFPNVITLLFSVGKITKEVRKSES